MDLSLCRHCVSSPADSGPHSLSPVVARDGSGVAGMSRSVPSSPGERSPSDKFNPGEELGNSSEVSQPAEVSGKCRECRPII